MKRQYIIKHVYYTKECCKIIYILYVDSSYKECVSKMRRSGGGAKFFRFYFSVLPPKDVYLCAFDRGDRGASFDILMSFLRRLENFLRSREVKHFHFQA